MSPADDSETRARPPDETAAQAVGSHASSTARFTPGELLAGRYRIIAPLGKGGMGEVYRADDTRLGQPVALKFLPEAFAEDSGRLERLVDEVRIGRQIAHPNVCRLYDIAEAEGHHFLVMEYVDGEDLASLLRRIGRLPADKTLEIARGICAGLAAAHDKGIIHRDLKPANVMIDGRGHARIADFGLAALSGSSGADMSGTPQYMAPEQLSGQGASLRSDVYAIGLVVVEMVTGKRVLEGKSLNELRALHAEGRTLGVILGVEDADPHFKRILERCLAAEPKDRWASAAAVLQALPGGDPLQAAMRVGETPSPEMVAAASRVGDLRPQVAWACLLAVLTGLVGVGILARGTVLYRQVSFEKPPAVMVERARQILREAGVSAPSADWAGWFEGSTTQELYCGRLGICFVYRGGAGPAESGGGSSRFLEPASGEVDRDDPPFRSPGMSRVILDTKGRLTHFSVVPPSFDDTVPAAAQPDWTTLFKEAGFHPGELTDAHALWTPVVASETRVAWKVSAPRTDGAVRVEAAAFRGRPVDFRVIWEWDQPKESIPWDQYPLFHRLFGWWGMTVFGNLIVVVAALALARRNLRLGSSDTAGALRIACFFLLVRMLATLLSAHHVPSAVAEARILRGPLARDLWDAVQVWVFYVALEPFARRRWPHTLISWSRLLKGRVSDPLVGRDWLFGAVCGTLMGLAWHFTYVAPAVLGLPLPAPFPNGVWLLNHVSYGLSYLVDLLANSVEGSLLALFLLSLFRIALRRDGLAILALLGTHIIFNLWWLPGRNQVLEMVFLSAIFALWVFTLVRFGLLALIAAVLFLGALRLTPVALDPGAWYGAQAPIVLTLLGATAAYAFRVSLAGRPALGSRFLDD